MDFVVSMQDKELFTALFHSAVNHLVKFTAKTSQLQ